MSEKRDSQKKPLQQAGKGGVSGGKPGSASDDVAAEQTAGAAQASSLDPFEIEFLPQFEQGRGPREPFVNRHGVVIGDHDYESANSPLENWSADTDPSVMAGDEWVHPFKDVGFQTDANRDLFERGIAPQGGIFMHPDKNAAYDAQTTPEEADGTNRQ
ncbi:DUF3905 domain-containing protein [Paenibacillus athensensis]|uniref:DUF3905 domain-containing protein n=1 Tax=Paenibacillus athensensis TaxID=1967502 RepID=A0A4Y8Q2P9_9BACL|nr:DUF3905 domain-containing protein [Paenibacillus athensensis]MCD1258716.1 DUF3905 domain-containing protein [Paenibacillus athensensis]